MRNLEEIGEPWAPEAEGPKKSRLVPMVVCTLSFAAVLGIILVTTQIHGGDGSSAPAAVHGRSAQPGSGASPKAGSTVRDWYVRGGQDQLTTVTRDVTSIQDDAAARDMTSMQKDCGTLQSHVQVAQVYAPLSDPQTESHWSKALDQLGQAAADCTDGTTGNDSALISKSAAELRSAGTELDLTTALINSLAGA